MTTPLEVAWEHYGGRLLTARAGRNKATCPLHDDSNPSATVNITEQKWSCHAGCGYGDIYELIKLAEPGRELSFPEQQEIARTFGTEAVKPAGRKKRPGRRKPSWVGD